jgi:tetratricopeptide (TPR) repeat protein
MLRKLLFYFALLVVAGPAAADDTTRCAREVGGVRIAACTGAINSGAGRPSINYTNRGDAYRDKGDTDRAIADYNEAIRLDPKNAIASNNLGHAYGVNGDSDRALPNSPRRYG